jgi:hypothetical protein
LSESSSTSMLTTSGSYEQIYCWTFLPPELTGY